MLKNRQEQVSFILRVVSDALERNVKKFDASNGEVLLSGTSYEDLGDYLPALLFYKVDEMATNEVAKTVSELEKSQFIFTKDQPGITGCFSRAYDQSDLIWGLQLAAMEDKSLNSIIDKALDTFWLGYWCDNGVMMRLTRLPYIKMPLKYRFQPLLKVLSAEDHGMFIELYAHQFSLTGDVRHLDRANTIYESFISTAVFKKYGIFPFYSPTNIASKTLVNRVQIFRRRAEQFQLLKQNSNILWGLFKVYELNTDNKILADSIQQILDGWLRNFFCPVSGVFFTNYDFTTGGRGADLTCFHMIELLVESARQFGRNDHLDKALQIAESFLRYQSHRTSLVPFLHPSVPHEIPRFQIDNGISWLDSTVDFAIAILKLGLTASDKKLVAKFERIADGVVKYHRLSHGYASSVAIEDGHLIDATYSTKMTALVLKLFIAQEDMANVFNRNTTTHYALHDR